MFTGIIESIGEIISLNREGSNLHVDLRCDFTHELKIDQSLAHDGVCLTVVAIKDDNYTVTAIDQILVKSNLGTLQKGDLINLERSMKLGDPVDGHLVKGHVDQIAECRKRKWVWRRGNWTYTFAYDPIKGNLTIEKGFITVNGVSLTVIDSKKDRFSVAINPYTHEHTNFHKLAPGKIVNLEFD